MLNAIRFREIVDFTRYELLGHLNLPTPSDFDNLSDEEKSEVYTRLWTAVMNASTYMTSALNIDEIQAPYM